MRVESPRLRVLLGTQWRLIVAVLVVVAVGSFVGAGTTLADQPTEVDVQQTHNREVVTSTTTRATVVGDESLWPAGTVLVDKPVYLLNTTPTMNATARTRLDGAADGRITHEWRLTIQVRRGGEQFYAETTTLASATHRGTTANTTAVLDMEEIRDRIVTIRNLSRGAGTVTASLRLQVDYRTDPGESYSYTGNETYNATLDVGTTTYVVGEGLGGQASRSTPRQVTVTQPPETGNAAGMALLGVLALGAAVGIYRQDPDDIDVDRARIELHSRQYEDWISPGVIPMGISQQFVELETIEDVVDVAIDTNERVVYDRRRDLYAVISENVVYYFSTGGSWMESAFRGMRGPGDGGVGGGPPGSDPGDFGFGDDDDNPFGGGGDDPFGGGGDDPIASGDDDRFGDGDDTPFGGSDDDAETFGDWDDEDNPFSEPEDGPFSDGGKDE